MKTATLDMGEQRKLVVVMPNDPALIGYPGDRPYNNAQVNIDLEHLNLKIEGGTDEFVHRGLFALNTHPKEIVVEFTPELQLKQIHQDGILMAPVLADMAQLAGLRAAVALEYKGRQKTIAKLNELIDLTVGTAKRRHLTDEERADTQRHVEAFLSNYKVEELCKTYDKANGSPVTNYSAMCSDLMRMVNVAKGGYP